MTIDPKTSMYINIAIALLGAIVGGGISFTGILPDPTSAAIVKYSAFVLSIYGVVNASISSVSSNKSGPLAGIKLKFWKKDETPIIE